MRSRALMTGRRHALCRSAVVCRGSRLFPDFARAKDHSNGRHPAPRGV